MDGDMIGWRPDLELSHALSQSMRDTDFVSFLRQLGWGSDTPIFCVRLHDDAATIFAAVLASPADAVIMMKAARPGEHSFSLIDQSASTTEPDVPTVLLRSGETIGELIERVDGRALIHVGRHRPVGITLRAA